MSFYREFVLGCVRDYSRVGAYLAITGVTGFVCGGTLGAVTGGIIGKSEAAHYHPLIQPYFIGEGIFLGTFFGAIAGTAFGIAAPISVPIFAHTAYNSIKEYNNLKNKD